MNLGDLSLLWSMTILAIMVAINARGPIKIGLSWFLTTLILVITISMSSMKFSSVKTQLFGSHDLNKVESQIATPPSLGPVKSSKGIPDIETQTREYLNATEPLVGSALSCARSILNVDLQNLQSLSDTQYEREQSRALSLRNQSSTINRQIKALKSPVQYKSIQAEFDKAAENLRLAGWALHAYFSAENSEEESSRHNTAINNAQAALNTLRTVQQQLNNR
ncbi:MAG: hypothetical protein GX801_05495 [Fibrobacter sp.]|nr:hypothetical protein [Fibrobacter sp.]